MIILCSICANGSLISYAQTFNVLRHNSLKKMVFPLQCGGRSHRLLHCAGCHVGHGRVWGRGGYLQLRQNPLLSTYQHDSNGGEDSSAARKSQFLAHVAYLAGDSSILNIIFSNPPRKAKLVKIPFFLLLFGNSKSEGGTFPYSHF